MKINITFRMQFAYVNSDGARWPNEITYKWRNECHRKKI